MRKFLALQWILLIAGISVLTVCKFDCELPQELLDKLKLYLQVNIQKIQIEPHCITLSNFNYKNFSCKHLKISWKSLLGELQYYIEDGCLFYQNKHFYTINGRLYGRFGKIRGFLDLKGDTIKNIQISCLDCVKISEITKHFQQTSNARLPTIEHLNLNLTTSHKQSIKIYGEGKGLQNWDMRIADFQFLWPLNGKENLKLWAHEIRNKKVCLTNVFLKTKSTRNDFLHWGNGCFLGNLNIGNIQDFSLFLQFKNFVVGNNNFVTFVGNSSDLNFAGKGTLNLTNQDFKIFSCKGWLTPNFSEISKIYPIPYTIALDRNLFFSIYGTFDTFGVMVYTRNFLIDGEKFFAAQVYGHYQKERQFSGQLQFHGKDQWLKCHVRHKFVNNKGFLRMVGCLSPNLTYPLKDFLPDWWQPFFKNFEFHKNFPQTNFIIHWNKNSNKNVLYGNVSACDFRHKTSNVESLNLVFGHRPGYCLLDIKNLKTQEGKGNCIIHWPYNCKKTEEEFWKFKGSGNFNVNTWEKLINDFVEQAYCNKIAGFFQENSIIQADFYGKFYRGTNPQEILSLSVTIPQTILYHFPLQKLKFYYHWTPQGFSIESAQGMVSDNTPFKGRYTCQQKRFDFELKADHLQTEILLQHPLLRNWNNAIPEKNRSTYTGKLDLKIEGNGNVEKELHVSGKGWVRFDNPQLSQIHLLGPLQHLFSKQFKWKPTIELDCLISDFTFTEKQIESQNTILSGPSTRANVSGKLHLDTSQLNAKVHFSFLDYQQLKLPIMKQLFQLFQPISKGFAASVQGTFENPQWTLTFNPFRFVLPQKTVCEKRKKLALQKGIKSVH